MAIGGSIESVSIKNRLFPVAADADVTITLGGFNNEVQSNGNGSTRQVKTRVPWMLDGVQVELDNNRGDLEFLQEVADGEDDVVIALTMVDGNVYQGQGTLEGEVTRSTQTATGPLAMKGPGKLTLQ